MPKTVNFFVVIFVWLWAVSASAQTDFSAWDKRELRNPSGSEIVSPSGGPFIRIQTYPRQQLERAAGKPLSSAGSGTRSQLEYALSILALSLSWNETFDGQVLSGLAQGADGPYSFKIQFTPKREAVTVALLASDQNGRVLEGAEAETRRAAIGRSGNVSQANKVSTSRATSRAAQYLPPETVAQMDRWPSSGKLTKALRPNDPLSPRYYLVQTGPKYGVYNFETAIQKLPTVSNLKLKGRPVVEKLEAWETYDGSSAAIVIQQTQMENQDGVIVLFMTNLFMTKKKGQNDIIYLGYEVTEDTYLAWGGITRMMKLRRVIPSIDAFPKAMRDRISRAPFKQQTKLYEAGLNKVLENGAASMYAMSQAQTLMRMQELNYDLLLGGDITSPMISD